FDKAFAHERAVNAWFVKTFEKEYRAERAAKRGGTTREARGPHSVQVGDAHAEEKTLRSAKEAPFKTRREPDDPREIGAVYAVNQIESPYFQDWVHEQMVEAERMRQADPSSVMPLETQADARKVARNMLQQLEWDTKRELSESKEFYEGFDEVLQEPFTVQWLADILLEMTQEEIVPAGQETREARPHSVQVGDRVRAHWTHG